MVEAVDHWMISWGFFHSKKTKKILLGGFGWDFVASFPGFAESMDCFFADFPGHPRRLEILGRCSMNFGVPKLGKSTVVHIFLIIGQMPSNHCFLFKK